MKAKRISALISAIIMCLTLVPLCASAADSVTFTAVDGKAGNGGGIWISKTKDSSALTLNGGGIRDNTAQNGGGIYINKGVVFKLACASISGNTAQKLAGGIYADGASMTVGKAPIVRRNTIIPQEDAPVSLQMQNEQYSNIYLPEGKTITVADEGISVVFLNGSYITPELYVTAENGSASVTGACKEDICDYFRSDNSDYAIAYEDGAIKLLPGHIVTFVYNEAYGDIRISTVADGRTVKEPDGVPSETGYAFVGWLLNGKIYDFSTPVTGDITLTPKLVSTAEPSVHTSCSRVYVSGFNGDATLYLAAYGENGALLGAHTAAVSGDYSVNPFTEAFADIDFNISGASEISAFLWSRNMQPLCDKALTELK